MHLFHVTALPPDCVTTSGAPVLIRRDTDEARGPHFLQAAAAADNERVAGVDIP